MAWHYITVRLRLSLSLVLPGPRVREKCILHAGKMFFALHAENIFAYLLRHFSRIDRTPPKPLRGPAQGTA